VRTERIFQSDALTIMETVVPVASTVIE